MVRIAGPPPINVCKPLVHTLPAGTRLIRLFDPQKHAATAVSFRRFGPQMRFDHHRITKCVDGLDNERGVYYAGFTLSCCVVEIFGDTGIIACADWHIASPILTRAVKLLDLRKNGAMRAGSVAAISKAADHTQSQEWSRYFYDTSLYRQTDGLLWYNAHNDEDAVLLYERAENTLRCPPERIMRLDAPELNPYLSQTAADNNLVLVP